MAKTHTEKYDRSGIFHLAWSFIKKNGLSLAEALRVAWRNAKLVVQLHTANIVKFLFRKIDGTLREAYGTLHQSMLPAFAAEGSGRKPNPTVQVYFDTEKQEFRSFKKLNLLTIG